MKPLLHHLTVVVFLILLVLILSYYMGLWG